MRTKTKPSHNKPRKRKTLPFACRVEPDIHRQAVARAKELDRSKSSYLRMLIREDLARASGRLSA